MISELTAYGGGALHGVFGSYQITFLATGFICFVAAGLAVKISGQKKVIESKPFILDDQMTAVPSIKVDLLTSGHLSIEQRLPETKIC